MDFKAFGVSKVVNRTKLKENKLSKNKEKILIKIPKLEWRKRERKEKKTKTK